MCRTTSTGRTGPSRHRRRCGRRFLGTVAAAHQHRATGTDAVQMVRRRAAVVAVAVTVCGNVDRRPVAGHRSDLRSAAQRAAAVRSDAVAAAEAATSGRRRFSAATAAVAAGDERGGGNLAAAVCRWNGQQGAARAADERLRVGAQDGWARSGPMTNGDR